MQTPLTITYPAHTPEPQIVELDEVQMSIAAVVMRQTASTTKIRLELAD